MAGISSEKGAAKEIVKTIFLNRRNILGALITALGLFAAFSAAKPFFNKRTYDIAGITLSNVKIVNDHNGFVWFFSFSPDSKFLACSNTNWAGQAQVGSCDVWQVATATKVASFVRVGRARQSLARTSYSGEL
jgi:hypothetical protein